MPDPLISTALPQDPRPATRRRQTESYAEVVLPQRPDYRPVGTATAAVNGHAATDPAANSPETQVARLIPPPAAAETPRAAIIALQEWQGVVLEVLAESFVARVVDETGDHPDEEVELPIEDVSPFESDLLEPGAVFYWTIGYRQQLPRGQRERVSRLRFRRLPAWSQRELDAAHERAESVRRVLGWDEQP